MGLLDRFRTLQIEDPVLGPLRYQRAGFWEGKRRFAPVDRLIEFTVDAGEEGPHATHRRFYQELESRYPALVPRFEEALRREWMNWNGEPLTGSVWDEFFLEGFDVPGGNPESAEWALVFPSRNDGHYFCLLMRGWDVESVRVDG
jgi:hypothetical protein